MPKKIPDSLRDELIEKLADIEHQRWAHWQEYLHSKCLPNPDGSLTIPSNLVSRWKKQIGTPYTSLSPEEQFSDKEQVEKALIAIEAIIKKL